MWCFNAGIRSWFVSNWVMSPIELWQVQSLRRANDVPNHGQIFFKPYWKLWEIPFVFAWYGFGHGETFCPFSFPDAHLLESKPKASLMTIKDLNFWPLWQRRLPQDQPEKNAKEQHEDQRCHSTFAANCEQPFHFLLVECWVVLESRWGHYVTS